MAQTINTPSLSAIPARTPGIDADQSPLGQPGSLKIADLTASQGLTDRFDEVLLTLCDTSRHVLTETPEDATTRFCHHIKHTLNADTAYLCNRASLSVVATSTTVSARETCEDTRTLHAALTTMISDLWNCNTPLSPPDIKVFPEVASFSYLVIPLATQHDHLLIITNADTDKTLVGDYLADATSALYELFLRTAGGVPDAHTCQKEIFDSLHSKYRLSSKKIIQLRLALFQAQIKSHAVEFEGLSLASKGTKPDALKTKLSESLYQTAKLWSNKFKSVLDCHALIESAHGYKTLCDSESLLKFSDTRPLQVTVHTESLSDLTYLATLQDLTEKCVIHASRLQFDVILQAGQEHAEELRTLQDRFGIPHTIAPTSKQPTKSHSTKSKTTPSIADEFDVMQINGVPKKNATKQA